MSGRYGPCFACCLAALLVSLPTPLKAASIPRVVGYIGLLTDASGEPMAGPVNLELRLYDAASEGSLLFTETHLAVPLQNGVFAVAIGSETSGGLPGPAHETAPPLPMNRAMSEGFHRAAVPGPSAHARTSPQACAKTLCERAKQARARAEGAPRVLVEARRAGAKRREGPQREFY